MKTLLLFLALVVSAHGQTLKWEVTFEVPPITHVWAFGSFKSDAAGDLAICIDYADDQIAPLGVQFVWHNNTGAVLFRETDSAFKSGNVIQCAPSCALVEFTALDDSKVLRKYTRRGRTVFKSDIAITKTQYVVTASGAADPDRVGFFIVTQSDDSKRALGIKRYSLR